MPMNPATDEIVAELRESFAKRPPGPLEADLIAQTIALAPTEVPLSGPVLGEAMIQFATMTKTLIDAIREADRDFGSLLDWESTVTIAVNIAFAAGFALYTGGEG